MGMKLGEGLEFFSATKKAAERGRDALGMRIFSMGKELWPPGAEDLAVGFLQGNLVSIKVKYSGRHIQTLGGWDALLQETTATYGGPVKANNKRSLWRDNETGLLLVRNGDGGVIATFGELKSVFTSQDLE